MTEKSNGGEETTAGFTDLGLRAELLASLSALGYEEATPIQREAIPAVLEGRDLLGQAATGTGKTAAFALPLLQRWASLPPSDLPTALILVPTRELAMQVGQAVHRYGRELGVRVLPIYGGQPIGPQLRTLKRGVDVVVATPGRAQDHIQRGTLDLSNVSFVVLDEADEMLDMGFADDIETIIKEVPEQRQIVLFSATMPPRLGRIADSYLKNPVRVAIARGSEERGETPLIRQTAYVVHRSHKLAALGRILDIEAPTAALIFCRTRHEVDELTEALNGRGYRAEALHGGMSQEQRDRVMSRLRNGTADLLIATDVAARGLDIDLLTHVVNYDVPSAPESYVHRIGRVGRAGREGVAITLAEPREHKMLRNIERVIRQRLNVAKLPTMADLRARRLEITSAAIRETILGDDNERFRVVVESLCDEFDIMDIALAATKLAHAATGPEGDEQDIPDAADSRGPSRSSSDSRGRDGKPSRERSERFDRGERAPQADRGDRGESRAKGGKPAKGGRGGGRAGMVSIYIAGGRSAGIRPQDLVGAIANEANLSGRDIGAIQIGDDFSLVDVPEDAAAHVIDALRATKIKGKKVTVRRDRFTK